MALSKLVRLAALFWLLAVRVPGRVVGMTARTEPADQRDQETAIQCEVAFLMAGSWSVWLAVWGSHSGLRRYW